ncbi:MAG TPA: dihydrofolate reductase family protein [Fimbriimonadaceae bacterium]|nr:dihydrofolate reductase family protein [Fimbriimonadaceae bacterium]
MPLCCRVFIATSLDGFIARTDGSIDWLMEAQRSVPEGEDCGYEDFMEEVDVLVMGRNTFEQVATFDPWPYGDLPVIVLSSQPMSEPDSPTIRVCSAGPIDLVAELEAAGYRNAYIDGGQTIASFLREGLIQEMTITTIPILLGSGRPLFTGIEHDIHLERVATRSWPFGFVQTTYRVQG